MQARLIRQRRLRGDDPLQLTAIMSESTIHQQVGGPEVLAAQLGRLLELADAHPDTLDLRIVPYTATGHHAMGGSAFHIMTFPSPQLSDLVWQESVTSTEFIEDDIPVREYSLAYNELAKSALTAQQTLDLIKQTLVELR